MMKDNKGGIKLSNDQHPDGNYRVHQQDQGYISISELQRSLKDYNPRSKLVTMEQLRLSAKITLLKYPSSVYFGQCISSQRNGIGIMLYTNGRIYEGNWENNFKQGRGYELFSNGSFYEGEYVKGKPEGRGRYQWGNGQVYEGEWKAGVKQGSGIWRGVRGDSYIGEWRNGKADGYGVHTWINGDRYQGEFKDCLKDGEGVEKFSNGDSYKGMYSRGKPQGYGQYFFACGSYFKGYFKHGLREGEGIWKRNPGHSDKYQGSYHQDKKDGFGIFTWADGSIYRGNYKNDLRDGYGEMQWADGNTYKGMWQQGRQLQAIQVEANDTNQDEELITGQVPIYSNIVVTHNHLNVYHNEPLKPEIHQNISPKMGQNQNQPRKFRQRSVHSRRQVKSCRGERTRNNSNIMQEMRGGYNQPQPRLMKKMSVGSVMPTTPHSYSFYLGKPPATSRTAIHTSSARQVKTSGGSRPSRQYYVLQDSGGPIEQELKYFTRSKVTNRSGLIYGK